MIRKINICDEILVKVEEGEVMKKVEIIRKEKELPKISLLLSPEEDIFYKKGNTTVKLIIIPRLTVSMVHSKGNNQYRILPIVFKKEVNKRAWEIIARGTEDEIVQFIEENYPAFNSIEKAKEFFQKK